MSCIRIETFVYLICVPASRISVYFKGVFRPPPLEINIKLFFSSISYIKHTIYTLGTILLNN